MTNQKKSPEDAPETRAKEDAAMQAARRDFLAKCGKLAVITPPAVTLMLTAASRQAAASGDHWHHRHHHHRHHSHDD